MGQVPYRQPVWFAANIPPVQESDPPAWATRRLGSRTMQFHQGVHLAHFTGRNMKRFYNRFYNAVMGIAICASGLAAQDTQVLLAGETGDRTLGIQVAAVDTAVKFWTAEGRLNGKQLAVDPRPALSTIDGTRRLPDEPQIRPAARSADAVQKLTNALGVRPATAEEITPCADGRGCRYTPGLALLIIGEPTVSDDTATVVIGVSVVFEDPRGKLRPAATYQMVSLVHIGGAWRPIQLKVAGEG